MGWIWFLGFITIAMILAYHRASIKVWGVSLVVYLILFSRLSTVSHTGILIAWLVFLAVFLTLSISALRYNLISKPILKRYQKIMPTMSRTEAEALAAGTVSWEAQLFKGSPDWNELLNYAKPQLSAEEQAFLNGPVEHLCKMIDDWDITHHRADLSPELWKLIKDEGFFGLNIPKEFGGKAFSAYAHSQILTKLYSRSATVGVTVSVPNSLGPAELLLHYGTPDQKNYYLPRLARGEEVPCFALTGPEAGSDAGAMKDTGIVCWGEVEGKKVIGIKLNFNKRYITLAPIATVIGLAFKMYDPEHLLGDKEDLGITCALIPRNTPGVVIGRRHFPANIVFQNGPIKGKDVFIPIDWIIGGLEMAGHGWQMLMECLASGRAISLPASAIGGAKAIIYGSGAYARVRRQFNVPIGRFEGIEEVLTRIAGNTYMMDATRSFTAAMIDQGARPAVASAITKYHVTEMGRDVANDAMDLHGGKAICLGPSNYLMRNYESVPIAITVEGANILTRCMIIFGQGSMRCHPYVFAEYEAAHQNTPEKALVSFDKAFISHMYFLFSNIFRTLFLGVTNGRFTRSPEGKFKKYFQQTSRFSSAFALLADVSILSLGGSLKRKESISGRLGDILSYLYILSATLKHFYDQGKPAEDIPLVHWSCQTCLYVIQQKFDEILKNFPNRFVALLLRGLIFPHGLVFSKPSDKLGHKVAQLVLMPTTSRTRLSEGAFTTYTRDNMLSLLEEALIKTLAAEPIEKIIHAVVHHNPMLRSSSIVEQANVAFAQQMISQEQLDVVLAAETARRKVISVDDFSNEDLSRINIKHSSQNHNVYETIHPAD